MLRMLIVVLGLALAPTSASAQLAPLTASPTAAAAAAEAAVELKHYCDSQRVVLLYDFATLRRRNVSNTDFDDFKFLANDCPSTKEGTIERDLCLRAVQKLSLKAAASRKARPSDEEIKLAERKLKSAMPFYSAYCKKF